MVPCAEASGWLSLLRFSELAGPHRVVSEQGRLQVPLRGCPLLDVLVPLGPVVAGLKHVILVLVVLILEKFLVLAVGCVILSHVLAALARHFG